MLNPDDRSLVTSMLTPPPGMLLDSAVATTFTLDPVTLLTVPLHLAWLSAGQDQSLLSDGIRLLEALRRVGENLTVYADRGRMQAPAQAHPLYSLLEPMIVEVQAPGTGVFHPKLWVLRFAEPDSENVRLRLGVLSRNLTADRSWDLALQLEGTPGGRNIAAQRELGELVRDLPTFAHGAVSEDRTEAAARLGDELRRTPFDLPAGWSEVGFHVLGRNRRAWTPPPSSQIAVISPFLSPRALDALCKRTEAVALVSRPEALAALPAEQRARFGRCLVLQEAAETEDGEENPSLDTLGLHAKALILRCGWDTKLFVGSTNATSPAMIEGTNLEVWAELTGKRSAVGGIEQLLGEGGIGAVLTPFDPDTSLPEPDPNEVAAELALNAARAALVAAAMRVRCVPDEDSWRLTLSAAAPVAIGGVETTVWPLSIKSGQAVSAVPLRDGGQVDLGIFAAADLTGMLGFGLRSGTFELRFGLNLPIDGLPDERDAAIVRRIIQNRDGFLRYLLLLLGELGEEPPEAGDGDGTSSAWDPNGSGLGATLLEELVRVFSRDRLRLGAVKRLVERLSNGTDHDNVIPPEFLSVWQVFLSAMETRP